MATLQVWSANQTLNAMLLLMSTCLFKKKKPKKAQNKGLKKKTLSTELHFALITPQCNANVKLPKSPAAPKRKKPKKAKNKKGFNCLNLSYEQLTHQKET